MSGHSIGKMVDGHLGELIINHNAEIGVRHPFIKYSVDDNKLMVLRYLFNIHPCSWLYIPDGQYAFYLKGYK